MRCAAPRPWARRGVTGARLDLVDTRAAHEQEQREEFILSKIRTGSSILGVYPPDEETLRELEELVDLLGLAG